MNDSAMAETDVDGLCEVNTALIDQIDPCAISEDSAVSSTSRAERKIDREHFLALISASRPQPRDLESQQANVMQLYQTFINLYIPQDGDSRALVSILTLSESSPALCNASKTISLLLLHRVSGESRLLQCMGGLYSDALRNARREAADRNADRCTLIGTAHFLSLCELFQRVSLGDSETIRPHAKWLITLMEAHRNEASNSRLQRMFHLNVRLVAAWEMLIARKSPCSLATLPHKDKLSAGTITSMSDLTLLTSSLIEDGDRLCLLACGSSLSHVLETIAKVVGLEGLLHVWMTNYLKTSCGSPYRVVETGTLPYLTSRGTRLLFRRIYEFVESQVHILFMSYWMCQLTLVDTHVAIIRAHKDKLDTDASEILRLETLANEYADHLSKSLPILSAPHTAWAYRTMAVRPLHLLLLYYRQHKEWQKLSWCVECAQDIGILVDQSCTNRAKDLRT